MKSKKALFEFFKTKYGKDLSLSHVGNETYGKRSFIYIYDTVKTLGVTRGQAIDDLVEAGFSRPGRWGTDGMENGVEIRVSYFKGWHWDE